MAELRDYSGELKQGLELEDFSRDFLIRMLRSFSKAYMRMDEIWYQIVKEGLGQKQADRYRELLWQRVAEGILPQLAKELDIQVNSMSDVFKVWQVAPDGIATGKFPSVYDIVDENLAILTVTRCAALERLEKRAPDKIRSLCQEIEAAAIDRYMTVFFPNAKVKPLLVPSGPREDPRNIACKWEFTLEPCTGEG
ncbi:MAG: hypothetical protein PHV74_12995 [Dehalococcoidia bacterium]|nr:hypothetical protein [Dehalococcoidia bacterium]